MKERGFKINQANAKNLHGVDIKAHHENGQEYFIECKGETKGENSALDFATGLGQLLFRMAEVKGPKSWQYFYLAIPKTKGFLRQYKKFSNVNLKRMKIRFFIVDEYGEVKEVRKIN